MDTWKLILLIYLLIGLFLAFLFYIISQSESFNNNGLFNYLLIIILFWPFMLYHMFFSKVKTFDDCGCN
jgi:hypothetical protein